MLKKFSVFAAAAALVLAGAAGPAAAQSRDDDNKEDAVKAKTAPKASEKKVDISIDDFAGHYVGRGVTRSRGSRQFGLASRDLDVKIEVTGKDFKITWTTVRRRQLPGSKKRTVTQTITFKATQHKNVWQAENSNTLMSGKPVIWARLRGARLTVYVMRMNPRTGGYASAVYTRELIEGGMQLRFRRVTEGNPVRTVVAYLEKRDDDKKDDKKE